MTLSFEVVCGGITWKSAAIRFLLSWWSAVTLQSEQVAVAPLQSPLRLFLFRVVCRFVPYSIPACIYMFQQLTMIWVRSHCLATARVQWGTWKAGFVELTVVSTSLYRVNLDSPCGPITVIRQDNITIAS